MLKVLKIILYSPINRSLPHSTSTAFPWAQTQQVLFMRLSVHARAQPRLKSYRFSPLKMFPMRQERPPEGEGGAGLQAGGNLPTI